MICRLHLKGPWVLNLNSNGAYTLGWTAYTMIVSALEAASDHEVSRHLETVSIAAHGPCSCLHIPRDGSIYHEAGSVATMVPHLRSSDWFPWWSHGLDHLLSLIGGQDLTIHPMSRLLCCEHPIVDLLFIRSQGDQCSLLCLETLFLLI